MTLLEILGVPTAGLPVPLTLSGHEQTPASRAAGTQGDGLTGVYRDSSIGAWEATTNLVTNSGFETNTTGWSTAGTNTIAASSEQAKFGAQSLKVTYGNTADPLASFTTITLTATMHTGSMWVYIPASYDGTALRIRFGSFTSATGTLNTLLDMTKRDQWQRVITDVTPDSGDLSGEFKIQEIGTPPTAGRFIYIGGAQVEAQPLATPYVHTDGGTASRTAARVRIPNISRYMSSSQGWIALLWQAGFGNTAEPLGGAGTMRMAAARTDSNNSLEFSYVEGTNAIGGTRVEGGVGTATTGVSAAVSAGDLIFGLYAFDPAQHSVAANGSAFASPVANTAAPALTADLDIGQRGDNFGHFDSNLLFVAVGRNPSFSAGFSAALNNIARNNRIDSRLEDLPGGATFKWPPADGDWRNGIAL